MRLSDTSALFTLYGYFVHVVCFLRSNACLVAHWKPTIQSHFFLKAHFCNLSGYFF